MTRKVKMTDHNQAKIDAAAEKFCGYLQGGGHHVTVGMRRAQAAFYAKQEGLAVSEEDEGKRDPVVSAVLDAAKNLW